MMKALLLTEANGPESARVTDVDVPEPGAGEVRVAIKSAALNHRELWLSRGLYPDIKLPSTLGADGCGIVEALGEGVDESLRGREVVFYPAVGWGDNPDYPAPDFACLGMPYAGTLAEFICVPADTLVAKPDGFSFAEAAALPLAGLTAWRCLRVKAGVKKGDKVLITGVGGGVAVAALTMALAMGAEVYVTSGSQHKIDKAMAMGASGGVIYKEEKWGKALANLAGGIDVVIDGAPAASFSQYVRSLGRGARVVIYGATGGADFEVPAPKLFLRHITLHGSSMGSLEDFRDMMAFVAENSLKPVIDKEFTLDQSPQALNYLEHEHQVGKVIVNI